MKARAIILVLDGVGIGCAPDAKDFGDDGAHTLGHVAEHHKKLQLPTLNSLGLGNLPNLADFPGFQPASESKAHFAMMIEAGGGKDSTAGHWEIAGLVLEEPFKTFPDGFPAAWMETLSKRLDVGGILGNKAASGTLIIDELGPAHIEFGWPIVYTSADPVLQIAAHEQVVSVPKLYHWCEVAFDLVKDRGISRVIARPFAGGPKNFQRTERRRDFSVEPTVKTLLDVAYEAEYFVHGIGKVDNLFAGRGFSASVQTKNNVAGIEEIEKCMLNTANESNNGIIFANLVDFDTEFGHRRDPEGFAQALESFDRTLPRLLDLLMPQDLLFITADHGNDPTFSGTDHTREMTPLLVVNQKSLKHACGKDLGIRNTFADIGQTVAEFLGLNDLAYGSSFLKDINGA